MSKEELAKRLKLARGNKGFKQEFVVKYLGTTVQKVSSFETSRTRIDIETLALLSELYSVDINYLIGIKNNNQSSDIDKLITKYRTLNEEGQEKVLEYVDDLATSGKYKKSNSPSVDKKIGAKVLAPLPYNVGGRNEKE